MTNMKEAIARFALVAAVGMLLAGIGAEMSQARGYNKAGNNTQPTTQRPTER
jgi:hypothetical protein